jgi:RNA polymerase sigma factor (sigma-70 family)
MRTTALRTSDPLADPEPLVRHVFAYVSYRVANHADAEDITSETFERAVRYRESFDPERGTPFGWLSGIADRCIAGHAGRRRDVSYELPELEAPGEIAEDGPRRLMLVRAIGELGDRDRQLIALRFGEDLTAKQIGRVLGMKTNAVEVALHRALDRLRDVLGSDATTAAVAATGTDTFAHGG